MVFLELRRECGVSHEFTGNSGSLSSQTMKGIQDDMGRAPAASAIHLWVGRHLLMSVNRKASRKGDSGEARILAVLTSLKNGCHGSNWVKIKKERKNCEG